MIEPEKQIFRPKIKVIGIGGGGGSIVSAIAPKIKKASFVAVDTDLKVLKLASRMVKIKNLLKGVDFCILISCLGGRIGSGVSPIFAEIARGRKILTLGIFILPFEFEGEEKMEIAKSSLEKIRPNLNASIVISNQNLFKLVDKKTSFKEALSIVNARVAENLEELIEMLFGSDLINIGFNDLKTILAGRGKLGFFNTVEVELPKSIHPVRGQRVQAEAQKKRTSNGVQGIARKVVYNRLSPYRSHKAERILFNITGGENLSINEVNQIGSIITNLVNPRAKVVFGVSQNKKYQDKIKITLLATGCRWGK